MPELHPYHPLIELTRGGTIESVHYGAVVIVNPAGDLVANLGHPYGVTFLRSAAKPFQALPFVEAGGQQRFGFTPKELALICSSHSGTDEQADLVAGMQAKIGIEETNLLCGPHPPYHKPTAEAMLRRGEAPTQNRSDCSGKHTGMLALARMRDWPTDNYLDNNHPVQQAILQTFAQMCSVAVEDVTLGVDGCSAPNFAIPLYHAALGFARLADPSALPDDRARACREITAAMVAHPQMVAGPGRFDTLLMQVAAGRLVAKGGAEGFQSIAILPGALGADSPALGIVIKISDGDPTGRARAAAALETLRQLGALNPADLAAFSQFGPIAKVLNWSSQEVGQLRPSFTLNVK